MTDIRRTLLWVVFSMSLFLIWDAWNKHNGQPSFFGPAPAKVAAAGSAPGAGVPKPATTTASVTSALAESAQVTAPSAQQVTVTTDLVKATLSSEGGTLIRLELLKEPEHVEKQWYEPVLALLGMGGQSQAAPGQNVVLMDESAQRLYVAETGLVPSAGGSGLPNHHTLMSITPGERTLRPGENAVSVTFESPVVGGVKLRKTYTFTRGDYVIAVQNEVFNESTAPVAPRLYFPARGLERVFDLHRTGHLRRGVEVSQGRLQEHRKTQTRRQAGPPGQFGQRMDRDGAALFRVRVADRQTRRQQADPRILHRQSGDEPVLGGDVRPVGGHRPRRQQDL
jgi:hypothetical protein